MFQGFGAAGKAQQQAKDLELERRQMRQELLLKQNAEERAQKMFDMQMENAKKQKDFFDSLSGNQQPLITPAKLDVSAGVAPSNVRGMLSSIPSEVTPGPLPPEISGGLQLPSGGLPQLPAKQVNVGLLTPPTGIAGDVQQIMQDPNEASGMRMAIADAKITNSPKPILDQVNKARASQQLEARQPTHRGDIVSVEQAQKAYPSLTIPAGATHVRVGFNRKNEPVTAEIAAAPKTIPSLFGKMTPEMASIGLPPDFTKYPGGVNDPAFQKEVQNYGKQVVALKQKNAIDIAETRGIGYAKGRALFTPFAVIDTWNDMALDYVPAMAIINSQGQNGEPGRYIPAGVGTTLQMKNAIIKDIQGASGLLRKAYNKLDKPFDGDQRAALTLALASDPSGVSIKSVVQALGIGGARGQLTPAQADVVIATGQAVENSYALRTVAGYGPGSDELRAAIKATLPASGTPSKEYALKQLDAFDAQVGRLGVGIPKVPIRGEATTAKPTHRYDPTSGKVIPIGGQ